MNITNHLKRYTKSGIGKRPTIIPSTLLPTGVYRASTSRYCWWALTLTFAPLPLIGGGIFLWHYPHARAHWALPSRFGLSGVRTFLKLNLKPHRKSLVRNYLHDSSCYYFNDFFSLSDFNDYQNSDRIYHKLLPQSDQLSNPDVSY